VNLGCSGFVYGVALLASLMSCGKMKHGLLLAGDTCYKTDSPDDRSTFMMFGDAGSATLLSSSGQAAPVDLDLMTDGSGFKSIIIPSGAYRNLHGDAERTVWGDGNIRSDYDGFINGPDVFSFSIREVPRIIKRFLESRQVKPEDFDALVLHQANLLILKQIAKKSGFPMDRVPISLDRYGNTSSASIPLTICDAYSGSGPRALNLLACGFGVGLSWGVMNIPVDSTALLPIILTDETYADGGVPHDS
jgi:3-oxoacyl-[acyl-carrier-protein] synthase-3